MTPSPQLEVIEGPGESLRTFHELTGSEQVAGRAPESEILLADRVGVEGSGGEGGGEADLRAILRLGSIFRAKRC
jgi:hypothetical protein